jgi:alpha-tubulin suppressor-like RCC1 family protein
MKLLLVDSRVADIATIQKSLLQDVSIVTFNYETETLETLLEKVGSNKYTSIGLFQENTNSETYRFMLNIKPALVKNINTIDTNVETWDDVINLFSKIKQVTEFTTLDLMGCEIYSSNDWKYIISKLETKLGININASIDYTGDASLGGNWILEEGNLNLIGSYFTDSIKEYKHILGGQGPSTFVITNVETQLNEYGQDTGKPAVDESGSIIGFNNSNLYGVGNNVANLDFYVSSPNFIKTFNPNNIDKAKYVMFNGSTGFVIDTNGKLWVTGSNSYSQLGTGDSNYRAIWVKLPNSLLDLETNNLQVVDVFGEYNNSSYSCLLLSDGSVWVAGQTNLLNLGLGTKNTFTKIYDPASNGSKKVVEIKGQFGELSLVFNNGTMGFARFGNGNIANSLTGFTKTIVSTDSAYERSVVLFSDGTVAAWADWTFPSNTAIGIGGASPYKYLGFPSGVTKFTKIYLNYYRNLSLISEDGSVWYWLGNHTLGNNGYVKVYDASTNSSIKAVKVNLDGNVNTDATIGGNSTIFILLENGSLMAGGKNWWGSFGNSNYSINQYLSAPQVVYTPTELTDKVTVVTHANACSLITKADGSVWAAGYNNGFGTYRENSTNYVVDLNTPSKHITTNGFSSALITPDNKLYTKGQNNFGQLGLGNFTDKTNYTLAYTAPSGLEIAYASMGGGFIPGGAIYGHLLMLLSDGSVWACGRNNFGQAGYGYYADGQPNFIKIYTPDVNDPNTKAITCSAGKLDSMFVLKNGQVFRCNADNRNIGPRVAYMPDVNPVNPGDKFAAVYASTGPFISSIVTADGSVWMIGNDFFAPNIYNNNTPYSAFGLGSYTDDELKVLFPGWNTTGTYPDNINPEYTINKISGRPIASTITSLKKFYRTYRPENNGGVGAVIVSCGGDTQGTAHCAIILANGSIWATGNNSAGQLGTNNKIGLTAWTKIYDTTLTGIPAKTVLCSEASISMIYNETVYSAGSNGVGQLGTGNRLDSLIFVPMKSIDTFSNLSGAFALNDAQSIIITSPAFGLFNIDSKYYGSSSFTISPPTSTSQGEFIFTSSDESIATIDSVTGEITLNTSGKLGTVTIRATQEPWRTYTATAFKEATFTILPLNPELNNFSIEQKWYLSRTLGISPFNIMPPTSLSVGAFSYISSNTNVATINSSTGEINIIGTGSTTIKATQVANGIYDTAFITTTFVVNPLQNPNLSNFTINDVLYSASPFIPTLPTHLGDGVITYSSSNPLIASINSSTGEITVNTIGNLGSVTITAYLEDNGIYFSTSKTSTFNILPLDPELSNFSVNNMTYGDSLQTISSPTSLSIGSFIYTILNVNDNNVNSNVISITGETISILNAGTVRIRATQVANGVYDTSSIETTITINKVLPQYDIWSIRRRPLNYLSTLIVNEPIQFSYINAPSGKQISNGSFTYTSSDPFYANINATTGQITINNIGETIITATQAETINFLSNTITAIFKVTNPAPVYGNFTISGIKRYGDASFIITTLNTTSTNPTRVFTFTSADSNIVSLQRIDDENTLATINSTGPVIITATQTETEDFVEGSVSYELNILKIITNLDKSGNGRFILPSGVTFGDSPITLIAPSSNRSGSFTFSSDNENIAKVISTIDGPKLQIVGAGTCNITVIQDETIYYYSDSDTVSFTVAKKQSIITSSMSNLSVNYGTASTILVNPNTNSSDTNVFEYIISNSLDNNGISVANDFVVTISNNVLTKLNAGTATITAKLLESDNFLESAISFNVTILPISTQYPNGFSISDVTFSEGLIITIAAPESVNPGIFTYTSSDSNTVEMLSVDTSGNVLAKIKQAGTVTITATETATNNYLLETISTSFSVLRADPILSSIFNVPSKIYGDPNFNLVSPTSNSLGSWTFSSDNSAIASINDFNVTVGNVGTTTITATQAQTNKYNEISVTDTFRVFQTPPVVVFNDIVKTYGDLSFSLITLFSSTNPNTPSFSSDDLSVATINLEGILTIAGAGTCNIIVTQDETENIGGFEKSITLTVYKADPTFGSYTFPNVKYLDPSFTVPLLQTNSPGTVTYSSSNSNTLLINDTTATVLTPSVFVGETTITISQEETRNFNSKSFTIPVTVGICFPAGTPVNTDQGIIAIEKINPSVNTIKGKKIVAITKTVTAQKQIVFIQKHCLAMNMPNKNTSISMNHKVLYKGKMERARDLVGKVDGILFKKYNGEVLYNVLMEEHSKMVVNNMIVETLDPTNIVAKLYNGNYTPEEFNLLSLEISDAVKKDDKTKFAKIYNSMK